MVTTHINLKETNHLVMLRWPGRSEDSLVRSLTSPYAAGLELISKFENL